MSQTQIIATGTEKFFSTLRTAQKQDENAAPSKGDVGTRLINSHHHQEAADVKSLITRHLAAKEAQTPGKVAPKTGDSKVVATLYQPPTPTAKKSTLTKGIDTFESTASSGRFDMVIHVPYSKITRQEETPPAPISPDETDPDDSIDPPIDPSDDDEEVIPDTVPGDDSEDPIDDGSSDETDGTDGSEGTDETDGTIDPDETEPEEEAVDPDVPITPEETTPPVEPDPEEPADEEGAVDPEPAEPDSVVPDPIDPGPIDPEPVDPGATDPGSDETDPIEPDAVEPGIDIPEEAAEPSDPLPDEP